MRKIHADSRFCCVKDDLTGNGGWMAEETKEVPARCTEITPATAPGEAEHADVAEWSGK